VRTPGIDAVGAEGVGPWASRCGPAGAGPTTTGSAFGARSLETTGVGITAGATTGVGATAVGAEGGGATAVGAEAAGAWMGTKWTTEGPFVRPVVGMGGGGSAALLAGTAFAEAAYFEAGCAATGWTGWAATLGCGALG
jgi:hypothetical protein